MEFLACSKIFGLVHLGIGTFWDLSSIELESIKTFLLKAMHEELA